MLSGPNPFAKKQPALNAIEGDGAKPNPFKKKLAPTKSLHKSESFFTKVNAAESQKEKRKYLGNPSRKQY